MSGSVLLVWSEELLNYDLGATHPMAPGRLEFTMALARDLDVLAVGDLRIAAPRPASSDVLQLVHDPAYVAAVRAAVPGDSALHDAFGLGSEDNPIFEGCTRRRRWSPAPPWTPPCAVRTGEAQHAVNLAGGLHHAMPARRVRVLRLQRRRRRHRAGCWPTACEKVAYVDLDAHHGDGVEAAFYHDPRVLTISLHESGYTAFPGTGFPSESGHGAAEGTAVNVALPPGTGDAGWLRAFHAVVPPLVRAFEPQILVTQLGCDTHRLDPLAQLDLSVDGASTQLCRAAPAGARGHRRPLDRGRRWRLRGRAGRTPVVDPPACRDHRAPARSRHRDT